ncbi:hypothetical protein I2W78_21845 [Streptomyces spinoverrucosus]|nr:hypothetical protein [Streptomyces spinoverrucosus]
MQVAVVRHDRQVGLAVAVEVSADDGTVEKYNKRGKHPGEFDPDTGARTKPADPSRKVTP